MVPTIPFKSWLTSQSVEILYHATSSSSHLTEDSFMLSCVASIFSWSMTDADYCYYSLSAVTHLDTFDFLSCKAQATLI